MTKGAKGRRLKIIRRENLILNYLRKKISEGFTTVTIRDISFGTCLTVPEVANIMGRVDCLDDVSLERIEGRTAEYKIRWKNGSIS